MYDIEYAAEAVADLKWFTRFEQTLITDGIVLQLRYEATVETRNRKLMRPNSIAEWELRIGEFRVLYDVDDSIRVVRIDRIGKKRGSIYFFRGHEETL